MLRALRRDARDHRQHRRARGHREDPRAPRVHGDMAPAGTGDLSFQAAGVQALRSNANHHPRRQARLQESGSRNHRLEVARTAAFACSPLRVVTALGSHGARRPRRTEPHTRLDPVNAPCAVRVFAQRKVAQAPSVRRESGARPTEHVGFREGGRARIPRPATVRALSRFSAPESCARAPRPKSRPPGARPPSCPPRARRPPPSAARCRART